MKKLLLMMIAMLISAAIIAQGSKGVNGGKKSFLAFHAGPAFPLGAFKDTKRTLDNSKEGGFAKTGFTVNLDYEYQFDRNVGLGAGFFANRFDLKKTALADQWPGLKADHWQIFGLAVGPVFNFDAADKLTTGIHIMGGLGSINSPKITYAGGLAIKEDWKYAAVFQGGGDIRYKAGKNIFLMSNLEYMYMRPNFTMESPDHAISQKAKQEIHLLNWSAGIGFKF